MDQFTFIPDTPSGSRPIVCNATMARHLVNRLSAHPDSSIGKTYLHALCGLALQSLEKHSGLPIASAQLCAAFRDPERTIGALPPSSNAETLLRESLLDYVQGLRRNTQDFEECMVAVQAMESSAPEILVTPDNTPSPLYFQERKAAQEFVGKFAFKTYALRETLVESIVALYANHRPIDATTLLNILWPGGHIDMRPSLIEGCACGQARAVLSRLVHRSSDEQQIMYSAAAHMYAAMSELIGA